MSLDKIISQYIDGELSHDDDELLRNHLADNQEAKFDFDNAIDLHMALRDDANSIKVPKDLERETEDMIMMKIIQDASASNSSALITKLPMQPKANYRYITVAAAIALLFIFVGQIDDQGFGIGDNIAFNEEVTTKETFTNPYYIESKTQSKKLDLVKTKKDINNEVQMDEVLISDIALATSGIDDYSIESTRMNMEFARTAPVIFDSQNEDIGVIDINSTDILAMQQDLGFNKEGLSIEATSYIPNAGFQSELGKYIRLDKLELTTFLSSELSGSEGSPSGKGMKNISQSISYQISDNIKLGIEAGYESFQYNEIKQVMLPIGFSGGTAAATPIGNGGANTKYIWVPITVNQEKQLFWGSAFFEHSLFNNQNESGFSLQTRYGIGLSSDGALFNARMYAKYELVTGINMTFGTDGKFYISNNSTSNSTNKIWRRTLSIVYGLQFNF